MGTWPLVVLGGPAMLIGLGGGAASSVGSGQGQEDLDFASVQRGNPEMERRAQEVAAFRAQTRQQVTLLGVGAALILDNLRRRSPGRGSLVRWLSGDGSRNLLLLLFALLAPALLLALLGLVLLRLRLLFLRFVLLLLLRRRAAGTAATLMVVSGTSFGLGLKRCVKIGARPPLPKRRKKEKGEKEKDGEKRMGIVRSTFIVDKGGILRHALYDVKPKGHAGQVLDLIRAVS